MALLDPQPAVGQVWRCNVDGALGSVMRVSATRVTFMWMDVMPDVKEFILRDEFYLGFTYISG